MNVIVHRSFAPKLTTLRTRSWRPALRNILFVLFMVVIAWLVWPAQFGGRTTWVVVSGKSLEPTFHTGDAVVTRSQQSYRPGQVVVYKIPNVKEAHRARVVHRLLRAHPDGTFDVQGDNNDWVDPWHPTPNDIVGAQVFLIPKFAQIIDRAVSPLTLALVMGFGVMWLQWPSADERDADGEGIRETEAG